MAESHRQGRQVRNDGQIKALLVYPWQSKKNTNNISLVQIKIHTHFLTAIVVHIFFLPQVLKSITKLVDGPT